MDHDPLAISWIILDNPLKMEVLMHMRKTHAQTSIIELAREGINDKMQLTKCIWELYNDHLVEKKIVEGKLTFELTESSKLLCKIIDMLKEWSEKNKESDYTGL